MSGVKTVSLKMGIKPGSRSILIQTPPDALSAMELPELNLTQRLSGKFDYIHLFVKDSDQLRDKFPRCKEHLAPTGMLWLSWPKASQMETDLNIKVVIKLGYDFGLVESKAISINPIWSAIKFTHPKANKIYNNSYGKLS